MPQRGQDLPPHLRPVERPPQEERPELTPPSDPPPPPPELDAPQRPVDPYLRQS